MTRVRPHDERGMTLTEVMVAFVIVAIIASAIASAMITGFKTTAATAERFTQSQDAQLLSSWLVTDLQSASAGGINTQASWPTGCSGGPADQNNVLALTWTDLSGPTTFRADYRTETVNGQLSLERFYCTNGGPARGFVVVHDLSSAIPNPAVASISTKYVNLTITTNGINNQPYTFTVSGGGRVGTPGVPVELSATSVDSNSDGMVDGVTVVFNRSLLACTAACTSDWTVTNQPGVSGSVHPNTVAIGSSQYGTNDEVKLTLAEPSPGSVDTVGAGMTVSVTSDATGVTSASKTPVSFSAIPVADGMAPILCAGAVLTEAGTCNGATPPISRDTDSNGKLDQIQMTFSEPVATSNFQSAPWSLSGNPGGIPSGVISPVDPTSTAVAAGSPNVLDLAIRQNYTDPTTGTTYNEVVDTAATGMTVALAPLSGGVIDSSDNAASVSAVPVVDGMAPILCAGAVLTEAGTCNGATPPISRDTDSNGKLDQIQMTFSEPVATSNFQSAPWSLSGNPGGIPSGVISPVDPTSTAVAAGSPNVLDLAIRQNYTDPSTGTTYNEVVDTAATGMTAALAPSSGGVIDSSDNPAHFSAAGVSDGMQPVLLGATLADASSPATPGTIAAGDTASFVFSENVTGLPTSVTMTVTGNGTTGQPEAFDLPGFVTIRGTNTVTGPAYSSGSGTAAMTCPAPVQDTTGGQNEWTLTCTATTATATTAGQPLSQVKVAFDSPASVSDPSGNKAVVRPNVTVAPTNQLFF